MPKLNWLYYHFIKHQFDTDLLTDSKNRSRHWSRSVVCSRHFSHHKLSIVDCSEWDLMSVGLPSSDWRPGITSETRFLHNDIKAPQSMSTTKCVATAQYPWKTSRTFTVVASQVIMVRPCAPSRSLPKIILQGIVDGSRCRGRPRKLWKDNIS